MEARYCCTEMKVPSRPAPPRPTNQNNSNKKPSLDLVSLGKDPFSSHTTVSDLNKLNGKKKPPPRPPLPKSRGAHKGSSQVFDIFGRSKDHSRSKAAATAIVKPMPSVCDERGTVDFLIDLSSPTESPTFSKSSSVHSLRSIESSSIGSNNTSQQLKSPIESGFEDDFGTYFASNATSPTSDLLSDSDPFSPISLKSSSSDRSFQKKIEESAFQPLPKPPFGLSSGLNKPTIIRPVNKNKPSRPPPPSKSTTTTTTTTIQTSSLRSRESFTSAFSTPVMFDDSSSECASPPMPSIPPPPPPPEVIQELLNGPQVPPRPSGKPSAQASSQSKTPYCKAEYDYETDHPDDLSFKAGDLITLIEQVNSDWLRGRRNGQEGIFPSNYVEIIVPLEDEKTNDLNMTVIALYPFNAETWDDLGFQEGDEIKVLRRINDSWLYGECNGRQGQFPEVFVQDITSFMGDS